MDRNDILGLGVLISVFVAGVMMADGEYLYMVLLLIFGMGCDIHRDH